MVRFKTRYLLFELIWEDGKIVDNLKSYNIFRAIQSSVQNNFGDYGSAYVQFSLNVKYYNNLTNLCIVRCSRDYYKNVLAAITLMTSINDRKVIFRSIHIGGTIKSCQKKALEFSQHALRKANQLNASKGQKLGLKRKLEPNNNDTEYEKIQKVIMKLKH